jgi:hypothetical protein
LGSRAVPSRIFLSLLIIVATAACRPAQPTSASRLPESRAIELARSHVPPGSATSVATARQDRAVTFDAQAVQPNRAVWAIEFAGQFRGACGPAPPQGAASCPPPATRMTVLLDAESGQFVEAFFGGSLAR